MKTIYIILIAYGALCVIWFVWARIAYVRALKDENDRIYQNELESLRND